MNAYISIRYFTATNTPFFRIKCQIASQHLRLLMYLPFTAKLYIGINKI